MKDEDTEKKVDALIQGLTAGMRKCPCGELATLRDAADVPICAACDAMLRELGGEKR